MKRTALLMVLLLALFSCKPADQEQRPLVMATIHPYELLLRELLGPGFEVRTLIPANASPHTYSPGPKDIKALREAGLALSNGLGLETDLERAFTALGETHLRAEELLRDALPNTENPHVWLSPVLMEKLALRLSERLQKMFPERSEEIANRALDLVARLAALDERISRERSAFGSTPLISFHDSFHHFNANYGINDRGSVQSSPGREPTPRELARLGELIRANGVQAICVEPQMDKRSAEVLAREFDLRMIELDPLGFSIKARTLPELIGANWDRMKQAWQPETDL